MFKCIKILKIKQFYAYEHKVVGQLTQTLWCFEGFEKGAW